MKSGRRQLGPSKEYKTGEILGWSFASGPFLGFSGSVGLGVKLRLTEITS